VPEDYSKDASFYELPVLTDAIRVGKAHVQNISFSLAHAGEPVFFKPQSYAEYDAELRRESFFAHLCGCLRMTLRFLCATLRLTLRLKKQTPAERGLINQYPPPHTG
jgi:hypothetical protein